MSAPSCFREVACALWVAGLVGCHRSEQPGAPGAVPGEAVAVVDGDLIGPSLVARIAAEQGLPAARATELAVSDALFSREAAERMTMPKSYAERIALARVLLEALRKDAEHRGPPSDDEIRTVAAARWWELDRPELRRTTHAVIRVDKDQKDTTEARRLAERVRTAVAGVRDSKAFYEAASAVPAGGLSVRVEHLLPVARDGRAVETDTPRPQQAHYASEFVDAVFSIGEVGDQSPIVKTAFGYHVILFAERIEERRLPAGELRVLLAEEIRTRRAEEALRALLEKLKAEHTVVHDRAAMELTQQLQAGE